MINAIKLVYQKAPSHNAMLCPNQTNHGLFARLTKAHADGYILVFLFRTIGHTPIVRYVAIPRDFPTHPRLKNPPPLEFRTALASAQLHGLTPRASCRSHGCLQIELPISTSSTGNALHGCRAETATLFGPLLISYAGLYIC